MLIYHVSQRVLVSSWSLDMVEVAMSKALFQRVAVYETSGLELRTRNAVF